MSFLDFDSSGIEPNQPFEAVPAGDYVVQVVSSEIKPTAAGTGEYLKLELEILGPSHQGRKIFDQLNIRNESAEAERIGRAQLSAVCHAIGRLRITDSTQLHGVPMQIKVTVDDNPKYGKTNKVKGYKAISGTPTFSASVPPATPPLAMAGASSDSPKPAASAVPPWQRTAAK